MKKVLYILGKLADADIDWLLQVGRRSAVPRGATLVREGEPIDALYIVVAGRFDVAASSAPGRSLASLTAGDVVGELSFLDARPPVATVSAAEDGRVLAVPKAALASKLATDTGFAARFYHALGVFLADRLRSTVVRLGYDGSGPLEQDVEYQDELDDGALDEASLAGNRFDWMLRRLQGA